MLRHLIIDDDERIVVQYDPNEDAVYIMLWGFCYTLRGMVFLDDTPQSESLRQQLKRRLFAYNISVKKIDFLFKVIRREIGRQRQTENQPEDDDNARTPSEWVKDSDGVPVCLMCSGTALQRLQLHVGTKTWESPFVESAFCPHCGKKMINGKRGRNG